MSTQNDKFTMGRDLALKSKESHTPPMIRRNRTPPAPGPDAIRKVLKARHLAEKNRIASLLLYYRTQRGLSQESVAEALGVTAQQVHKYETGRNKFPSALVRPICGILKIAPSMLFNESGRQTEEKSATAQTMQVAHKLNGLSPRWLTVILNIASAAKEEQENAA